MTTKTTKTTKTTAPAVKPATKTTAPAVKATAPKAEPVKATAPELWNAVSAKVNEVLGTVKVLIDNGLITVEMLNKTFGEEFLAKAREDALARARASRISSLDESWESLSGKTLKLTANDSKSSVGRFIIKFLTENEGATAGMLAEAFEKDFVTVSGIKPDFKWARRNVKEFIVKGLMKAE